MDKLPLDIFFDILSRIPVKSLLQSRSVSKSWLRVIDHPFLAAMHASRCAAEEPNTLLKIPHCAAHNQKPLTFHEVREHRRSLRATDIPIATFSDWSRCTPMGSCNGLLCFACHKDKQCLVLSNPLRNVFFVLPKAAIDDSEEDYLVSCGLGFDASTSSYKVVRILCSLAGPDTSRVEVHRVGTSSWEEITEVPPYPVHGKAVFAHGVLHWLVSPFVQDFSACTTDSIVAFDVGEERFRLTPPHPTYQSRNTTLFQLLDLKGDLGMADLSSQERIDVWVMMEDFGKNLEWVREYRIEMQAPWGRVNNGHVQVIGLWGENGEIMMKTDEGFFIYSAKTGGLRYDQSLGLESDSALVYSLRGSLIDLTTKCF
ncbi:hypothetical protein RHGRI_021356 [Rhododendron griersonianum]|uniref:F-box domain-containing protein n=1 Tax=Rhododendron griersonianum TaxID=479676 RepID=A0AAV6JJY3_9ERIC|nr:hypothetical protein RHGRI_021356 [Rhododendron griersonianum]